MSEIENLNNESNWGGAREGAGRPVGVKNKTTIERQIAEEEFKNRILASIHDLLNTQMNIAKGASYLYRIDETGEGSKKKREHVLVTDSEEIKRVLDEVEGTGQVDDSYYYITTRTPDNKALDSLIDRVFGRPSQSMSIDHTTKGDKIGGFNYVVPNETKPPGTSE